MKKSLFLVMIISLVLFNSCRKSKIENKKINVVSTINPYHFIVKEIGGNRVKSEVIIPEGASPHSFAPTPSDIKKLESASIVIANGLHLEEMFEDKFAEIDKKIVYPGKYIPKEMLISFEHDEHSHKHEGFDPHIWLDPYNIAIAAQKITDKLVEIDPESKEYYLDNLIKLNDNLQQVDKTITEERKKYKTANVVLFHNAFGYFFKRYDINIAAIVEKSPGKIPSPKDLVEIGEKLKVNNAKVILIQPQFSRKAADVIANEFNLEVDMVDQLGFTINATSISELIMINWNIVKKYFN